MADIYEKRRERVLQNHFYIVTCPDCSHRFYVDSSGEDYFPCPGCGRTVVYNSLVNARGLLVKAVLVSTVQKFNPIEVKVHLLVAGQGEVAVPVSNFDWLDNPDKKASDLLARLVKGRVHSNPAVLLTHMPPRGDIGARLSIMHKTGALVGKTGYTVNMVPNLILAALSCPDTYPYSAVNNEYGLSGHWERHSYDAEGNLVLKSVSERGEDVEERIHVFQDLLEQEQNEDLFDEDGDDDGVVPGPQTPNGIQF